MGHVLVVACDGLTDDELHAVIREISQMDLVDDVLACTDEQARNVRRAVDW